MKRPSTPLIAPLTATLLTLVAITAAAPPEASAQHLPSSVRLEDERNTVEVFRDAAPGTVFVTQKRVVRDAWSPRTREYEAGSGSGFVWDKKGHVVTNYHVIANGSTFTVTTQSGDEYPARLVGGDPNKDIAVLRIKAPARELHPIPLPREGYELIVGQKTLAIGNPFGLDHTLTTGVVSALDREMKGYGGLTITGMIQTDASIVG